MGIMDHCSLQIIEAYLCSVAQGVIYLARYPMLCSHVSRTNLCVCECVIDPLFLQILLFTILP